MSFANPPGATIAPPRSVVVRVQPDNRLESVAFAEIVTASLVQKGIKVTSYQDYQDVLRARARYSAATADRAKAEDSTAPKSNDAVEEAEPPRIDADYLVKITLLPQSVQQKFQRDELGQNTEVHTITRLSLVTVSVLDRSEKLVKMGSISYGDPVSVSTGAFDIGEAITQQLTGAAEKKQ